MEPRSRAPSARAPAASAARVRRARGRPRCHAAGGDAWLLGCALGLLLLLVGAAAAAAPVRVRVLEQAPGRTVLELETGPIVTRPVSIGGVTYRRLGLAGEAHLLSAGDPDLPVVARSVVVGDDDVVAVHLLEESHHDLGPIAVAPSKGLLYRDVDPASVPYAFGPSYQQDAFFPGPLVRLGDPYILRDRRGVAVRFYPLQYDPVERRLRIYQRITVEVVRTGGGGSNPLLHRPRGHSAAFDRIAWQHFLNAGGGGRYTALDEEGSMLIIAADSWLPDVQPLVDHKRSIGIDTTAVGVSSIGNDAAAMKAYIQSAYDGGNLAFVLLVGDGPEVAVPHASGGSADPTYAKLAGADDYPDILVGRFSAESAADVATQVERTIDFELGKATEQTWYRRGVGLASAEGPGDDGEMDWEHVDHIRDDLIAYGYTVVDQLYDPGVSSAELISALNDGRGIINYTGHGSKSSFGTSGFSSADVPLLSNAGMLPFVWSVACNTGEFEAGTCLAESLLRATAGGQPTGAVAMYASSILQSWSPPMAAQDESVDLLVAEAYLSFGALCFAGSAQMMDEYGAAGVEMFNTWHIFGDPSLRVVGSVTPITGLLIKPAEGLEATGDAGGPFTPSEQSFTVESFADVPIELAVEHAAPWLDVEPAAASISPGGVVTVTAKLNAQAATLPNGYWEDSLSFVNQTNHDGDAKRHLGLTVGQPELQQSWPLDDDPGWSTEGQWAFGPPAGLGGSEMGSPDPAAGHSGGNVYGYNLDGDYASSLPATALTSDPIDCSDLSRVSLRFWRWLNVEGSQYDHASVSVSVDGSKWTHLWQNTGEVADSGWQQVELDLSEIADGEAAVQLRWTMGPTDAAMVASGWNIDDVQLWAVPNACADADGDGALPLLCGGDDCDDTDGQVGPTADEQCDDGVDNDCNGLADAEDSACQRGEGGASGSSGGPPEGLKGVVCGCRLPGGPARAPSCWWLVSLAGLGLLRRRRRGAR